MNCVLKSQLASALPFALLTVAQLSFGAAALENMAFEDIQDGRPAGWTFFGQGFTAERGVGHNGSGGVVWESATPTAKPSGCVRKIDLPRGRCYRFSCLVKMENFSIPGRGGASMHLEWYDAKDKWMAGAHSEKDFNDRNTDWYIIGGVTKVIPPEAKTLRIQVRVSEGASGKVSFDNVTVKPLDRDPVAFVFSSAYRDMAASGKVRFHAALHAEDKGEGLRAEFEYVAADGSTEKKPPSEFTPSGATISLDVAALAMGTHPVTCRLFGRDGKPMGAASCDFTRVDRLPSRRVWIDGRKRCLIGGKPFFPLGMYWGKIDREKLEKYAEGPFNCLMPYTRATKEELDLCQSKGFKVFINLKNETLHSKWARHLKITSQEQVDAFFLKEIAKVKDHPALLAWYVNDEAPEEEIPERTHLYRLFRERDPDHPTWAVLDRVHDLREFIPTFDILGVDPYPVAQKPVKHVTEFMRGAREKVFDDRPFWNVPQTFNWAWYRPKQAAKERFPTEREMRNMNWQHIAMGANGLVAYCYHVLWEKVPPDKFDDYWKPICRAAEDVRRMIPILLSDEEAPVATCSSETVPVRTWKRGEFLYVLAVNASDDRQAADVVLPHGSWKADGCETGCSGRMVAPNRIRFMFEPLDISLMRLKAM